MANLSVQSLVASPQCADLDDASPGVGPAGQNGRLDVPTFSRSGQFYPYILALQEQRFCTSFYNRGGQFDQNGQGSERPSRHHVDLPLPSRNEILGTTVMDDCGGLADPRGFAQEGRFLRIALDQM